MSDRQSLIICHLIGLRAAFERPLVVALSLVGRSLELAEGPISTPQVPSTG